jgi:hypothetical protein
MAKGTTPWERRKATSEYAFNPQGRLEESIANLPAVGGAGLVGTIFGQPEQGLEGARSTLQGLTWGGGDELGSLIGAIPASIQTGDPYWDVYSSMMEDLSGKREAFREEHPVVSIGGEVVGGLASGGAGAKKVLATRTGERLAKHLPRWVQGSLVGGTEAGIYGTLAADPGERLVSGGMAGVTGALIGGPGYAGAKWLWDKGKSTVRWAASKLADTPRQQALRAIREALTAEGLDPEDAVKIYENLGPEGMVADLGDNFRAVLRAAYDAPGAVRSQAKTLLHQRQIAQGDRLMEAAQRLVGKRASDLVSTSSEIIERRAAKAAPIYKQAFDQGITLTDDLKEVLGRDAMRSALRQAKRIASNMGDEFSEGSLKHLHYAKMALWEQIDRAKGRAKISPQRVYGDLLDAIGKQNKPYIEANGIYSDSSRLLDAIQLGRNFFRTTAAEMKDQLATMDAGQKEMFQLGAVASFQDLIDNVQFTSDATRKLIGNRALVKKLALLFNGDERTATAFIRSATREQAFSQTRNAVAGSQTSTNLMGQQFLSDSIQPQTLLSAASGDPVGVMLNMASELLKKKPLSQNALQELGDMLLNKGLSPDDVRKLFASPRFTAMAQRQFPELVAQGALATGTIGATR